MMLAILGVHLTTLLVGGMIALGAGLSFGTAAVFGALLGGLTVATDPVAVMVLFRALGVPRRLAMAMEGESMFNDGTAIVVFEIALAAALSGSFDLFGGFVDFLRVAAGGLTVGLAMGWLVAQRAGDRRHRDCLARARC
jgi:CPA1 family monovalent cation:H+ antiporter